MTKPKLGRNRILLLTDSLALPRIKPEMVKLPDTWPELLKKEGYEIIQCSVPGGSTNDLKKSMNYYSYDLIEYDYVVIQAGIVDCSPRFVRKIEKEVLIRVPFGKALLTLLNKKKIRKIRKITYVNIKAFEKNIQQLVSFFKPEKTRWITIVPAQSEYELKLSGVSKNINIYNEIIKKNTLFIDLENIEADHIMSDFHHINAKGHFYIYQQILKNL
ncbi:MAG: hypothetical protein ACJASR_001239 [Psychroserpens sp.]|jgi:hypothetical protein